MKKTSILVAALIFACGLIVCPIGCTTGTNNKATKAEAAVIPSVNVAMEMWKARVESGKATQKQIDQVKVYYNTYYNSQLVLKAALEKSIASKSPQDEAATAAAVKSSADAQTAIVNLINQLLK